MAVRAMIGATLAGAGTVAASALLRRMRAELTESGRLSPPTVTWMYATYAAHATATAAALSYRTGYLPLPQHVTAVGRALVLAGAGLTVAGMSRFGGPRQVSGT